jgi:lycopene cyclase domain-containing protein
MMKYKYLFLELAWFVPVIIAQWIFAPHILRSRWKAIPLVAIPMAIYLSAKDRIALKDGTWVINEDTSTGAMINDVPIEEVIFFFLTSWVSAQGIILLSDERSPAELDKLKKLLQKRLSPSRDRR